MAKNTVTLGPLDAHQWAAIISAQTGLAATALTDEYGHNGSVSVYPMPAQPPILLRTQTDCRVFVRRHRLGGGR